MRAEIDVLPNNLWVSQFMFTTSKMHNLNSQTLFKCIVIVSHAMQL